MSFVLQRVVGRSVALSQVRGKLLRIGRATNAQLRSESPAVALEHATIELDSPGSFVITDKGSITGTYVNRKPVESARLARGDIIDIGDLRLEVQIAEPAKPLFLRIVSTTPPATEAAEALEEEEEDLGAAGRPLGEVLRAPKVDYASAYRLKRKWLTKVTFIAVLLIAALATVSEVIKPERQALFMPGGVSSAHELARDAADQPVLDNCQACHDPWKGVSDQSCKACHPVVAHAESEAHSPSCMSCHGEHRGMTRLADIGDRQCVDCHIDTRRVMRASVQPSVPVKITGFGDDHPELTARRDPNRMRFNHRFHLNPRGVPNAVGRRTVLECRNCHALVQTGELVDPVAIDMETHCQGCHKLTFDGDRRFANVELPHGTDPQTFYGFILATFAGSTELINKPQDEIRRILASRRPTPPDERALIAAEQVINKKCTKCHDIERKAGRLSPLPPTIETIWFDRARFSHGDHRNVDCESCHDSARNSTNTSDVLMPSREDCVRCHGPRQVVTAAMAGPAGGAPKSSSSCVACHRYHERSRDLLTKMAPAFAARRTTRGSQAMFGGGEGMIGTILLATVVVLLLVVLIPIGVVIYQRLTGSDSDRAAAARRPGQPQSDVPTKKVPPLPPPMAAAPPAADVPPPPPAPAPHRASSPEAATQMLDMKEIKTDAMPAGTEMVQWYGMLHCTAGVLEGQRFIVDEEGFYIGRDPSLSKVVIPDARISKRHVRILPRDGRVVAIDQNSTNGTFLGKAGGQRITEHQLKRGDTLVLADNAATFVYQI